ncbi:hypothetical protein [Lacrimispora amygdalina]|uniref:hypothetical protein n=1 Tax=Lacrimispora amygdalina TaxID=253257 RepID=UPI001144BD0D|nr:hypothetical protein [Lacrimispora amygdalina]
MMKDFMERAKKRLTKENLNTEDWLPDILGLETALTIFLEERGYSYEKANERNVSLYRDSTDNRLSQAEKMLKTITANKETALIHSVKRLKEYMDDFFEYYKIGNLKEFYLKKSGLYVEICLSINKTSIFNEDKESQRQKFERQINRLKYMGLDLLRKREFGNSYYLSDTENNKKLLLNLLKAVGAKCIEFKSFKDHIEEISAIIHPAGLLEYDIPDNIVAIDEDTQKKDKLIFLQTSINQIFSALTTISDMPEMIHTCGYLIEHYFADICRTLNVETKMREKVESYNKAEREKNNRIRKIENEIGKQLSGDEILNLANNYFNKIGFMTLKELGFNLSADSFISPYGTKLIFDAHSMDHMMYSFDIYQMLGLIEDEKTEEEIKKTIKKIEAKFDLIEPFHEERYIAYTENNMQILINWVQCTFREQFDSFEIANKKNQLYVKSFTILKDQID